MFVAAIKATICLSLIIIYKVSIHYKSFSNNSIQSQHPLQIIYNDLWGTSPVMSIDKKLYYVIFVDQYTKYIWLYTTKNKNEVASLFQQFQTLVE